ncbi:MAG: hypothetical protein JW869_00965 [Candidatus Omnitrophica bacterium]|nr:hypothetical protein [Candidatus Omnitrophota bacterium]
MKKFIILLIIIVLVVVVFKKRYQQYEVGLKQAFKELSANFDGFKEKYLPFLKKSTFSKKERSGEPVVIYFKNGTTMVGELLEDTGDTYVVNWKGQETIVYAEMVERIGGKEDIAKEKPVLTDKEITELWPYENDIVVRLTNQMVADAQITRVTDDAITLAYKIEGGSMEQDIPRAKVEYLLFKPVDNQASRKIEEKLREKYPPMESYKVGNFTIFTDSYHTWVQEYIKILRKVSSDLYFTFFELFKDRKPQRQNFVVIFDEWIFYVIDGIRRGLPAWMAYGYYLPYEGEEALYTYNNLGDITSEIVFQLVVGIRSDMLDSAVEYVKGAHDQKLVDRYEVFIDGQAKEIKDKLWDQYYFVKGTMREQSENTIRHEFTHETFDNWGLQWLEVSKLNEEDKVLAEEKKEILESDDKEQQLEIMQSLITKNTEELETQAGNSWLAEGIATYCATYPLGSVDKELLYDYQQMVREGAVYPLESLTGFRIGSFHGACPRAIAFLYAQSWAFSTFLMDEYRDEFMKYQKRMATEQAGEYDDIAWLLEAVGKDIRTLEKEFTDYMDTHYEEVEPPGLTNWFKQIELQSF